MGRHGRYQLGREGLLALGNRLHVLHVVLDAKQTHFVERFFLGTEVVIEAALLDAHFFGNILRAGTMKPFLREHAGGGTYCYVPLLFVFVGPCTAHGACLFEFAGNSIDQ